MLGKSKDASSIPSYTWGDSRNTGSIPLYAWGEGQGRGFDPIILPQYFLLLCHSSLHNTFRYKNSLVTGAFHLQFGTTKARKSMRDFSSLQRPGRIEHPSMPESLVIDAPKRISASSEPEEIGKHRDLTDAGSSQADLPAVDGTSLVSSTRKHSGEDTRHSEGSLTPPDSPPTHLEDSRVRS